MQSTTRPVHALHTRLWGQLEVSVPSAFPENYGFCIKVGTPEAAPVIRIHSRCAYSEVFGSLHCDCALQLEESIAYMEKNGGGLLFYLEQEGRGAGIAAKARAYRAYQDTGDDTFSHYEKSLGKKDLRDYQPVIEALRHLDVEEVKLISNNPSKISAIEGAGIKCTRVKLHTEIPDHAHSYIEAKRRHGHDM